MITAVQQMQVVKLALSEFDEYAPNVVNNSLRIFAGIGRVMLFRGIIKTIYRRKPDSTQTGTELFRYHIS